MWQQSLRIFETGIWLLDADNNIVLRPFARTSWEEVQKLFPPWKHRKNLKILEDFVVIGLGLAPEAISTIPAAPVVPLPAPDQGSAESPSIVHDIPVRPQPKKMPMTLAKAASSMPMPAEAGARGIKRPLEPETAEAGPPGQRQKQDPGRLLGRRALVEQSSGHLQPFTTKITVSSSHNSSACRAALWC